MEKKAIVTKALNEFGINENIEPYGNGHINDTFVTDSYDYLIQRINTKVFKKPEELMENIDKVTSFLKDKIVKEGGDPERETLTVVKTKNGENFYKVDDDNVYRVYKFVKDSKSIENSKTYEDLFCAGQSFGHFQMLLDDYPAETLHETIADFHNTPKRVEQLKEAIKNDIAGRKASVEKEIEFALKCADEFASVAVDELKKGTMPLRVTHNDTKINNILFDNETGKAICVIDLDTVMPGSSLYDFGDALRMGASTGAEDETNLDLVNFDVKAFESFAKGYLSEMKDKLTQKEIELLPFSAKLLTYECGIRFLADYLNGDTYFKIHREHHNLDRARNQLKLVHDISTKEAEMMQMVKNLL